jgi:hypothetical protein
VPKDHGNPVNKVDNVNFVYLPVRACKALPQAVAGYLRADSVNFVYRAKISKEKTISSNSLIYWLFISLQGWHITWKVEF